MIHPRNCIFLLIIFSLCQIALRAQTNGSVVGMVIDQNGEAVPNASVFVSGQSGQRFSASSGDDGLYNVPAVPSGAYTVTASATGFKRSILKGINVSAGQPTTVAIKLEVGDIGETVEVVTGTAALQAQTATVSSTISGREVIEIPSISRDALNVVTLMPGVSTVGRPRTSSINGLPKSAIDISADGVNVQDNANRTWDGFYAYVRPPMDAVEEVTVVNAAAGAESSGDGAAQIQIITKRGTNDYRGGVFWQHRNTALNSNYWFNNRDFPADPATGKAPRNRILLNQYGGRLGGPLPFPRFGEGGPLFDSGKDRVFFFVDYEEFRLPISFSRSRVVLTPQAQSGVYAYQAAIPSTGLPGGCSAVSSSQMQCRIDLLGIAAANSQLATADPMIAALLGRVRQSVTSSGSVSPITNDLNRLQYNFMNSALDVRKFLALRFDLNLTKRHSLELVINRQRFEPTADYTRQLDPAFIGFPGYSFSSEPRSTSVALRSSFSQHTVNELRYGRSGGPQHFGKVTASDLAATGGFNLNVTSAGISNPFSLANVGYGDLSEPYDDIRDSVTWIAGEHTVSFGGQFKYLRSYDSEVSWVAPVISFGVDPNEGTAFSMFNGSTLPGSSPSQQNDARNLYATLIGRVSFYDSAAVLDETGKLQENGALTRILAQRSYGLYVQDQWRLRSNLSLNFGIGWQPQEAFTIETGNAGKLEDPNEIYGVSGPGNLFKPGVLTGQAPRVVLYKIGEKSYRDDLNNFAPSVGVAWSPNFKGSLSRLFGGSGQSVFRAGYSRSFIREGSIQQSTPILNTPGAFFDASRATRFGNFVIGTNLRDPNNPNLAAQEFTAPPVFPSPLNGGAAVAVDPNIQTGWVDSFSFGYQRQIGNSTVVEVRYVGTRGHHIRRTKNLNEINVIENGFANEFKKAQANLYANLAAGRGASFAYFGPGTGTSPLPIMLAYFNSPSNFNPSNPAKYASANFTNSQLVNLLSVNAPNAIGFVSSGAFENNNAARRANALANGLPVNFFRVNPSVTRANILSDDASTWYDAAVIELRRRLSSGLRLEANYVFAKGLSNAFSSNENQQSDFTLHPGGLELARNVQAFDIRHAFKFNATYELPTGRGRWLFSHAGRLTDTFVGGWTVVPVIRWQSGSPFSLGNVQLVGMTKNELQREIKVRKGPNVVTYLPNDIILNTQRAFDISAASPTGYGTTFGGPPQGRFIAPAGYGNCIQRFTGDCGFTNLILHGPSFFMFDASVAKRFRIDERRDVELRVTAFDVLNHPAFRVGGWDSDVITTGVGGATFGQLPSGTAYQDLKGTSNPGGRIIDLTLRINF